MNLNHIDGKVIVAIDLEAKNWHTFSNGTKIRRERQFNEFNRRISEPTNAIVISGENIKAGAEILIHPNAVADHHQIHDFKPLSGEVLASDIKYYSIPEDMCFAWLNNGKWETIVPHETALRVFKPYTGIMQGIEPTLLKDTLYCTSGEYEGLVLKTVKAADYEIVFQDTNGKEGRLIRWRPNGCSRSGRESEAIAILHTETEEVRNGNLLVGLSISDCKPINELVYD